MQAYVPTENAKPHCVDSWCAVRSSVPTQAVRDRTTSCTFSVPMQVGDLKCVPMQILRTNAEVAYHRSQAIKCVAT